MAIHLTNLPVASPGIAQEAAGRFQRVVTPENCISSLTKGNGLNLQTTICRQATTIYMLQLCEYNKNTRVFHTQIVAAKIYPAAFILYTAGYTSETDDGKA
jgi:hypothetical protein